MGWDGSGGVVPTDGTRTGDTVHQQQQAAGVNPRAALFDAVMADLADSIENTVTRDGQNTPSTNLPMGNNKHTGVADATAATEYATFGQLSSMTGRYYAPGSVGGTGDAVTLTTNPAVTGYTVNMFVRFQVEANNTGAVTVQVDSLTAASVKKVAGYDLDANDWRDGDWVDLYHDGTNFQWVGGTNVRAAGRRVLTQAAYDNLTPVDGVEYLVIG